jgi:hypothetical protein
MRRAACCIALFAAVAAGCNLVQPPTNNPPPPKPPTATATISGSNVTIALDGIDAHVVNVVVNEGAKKLFEGPPSAYPHTITGFTPGTHTVTVDGWPTPPGGGGQKIFSISLTFGVDAQSSGTVTGFTNVVTTTSQGSATVDFGRKFSSVSQVCFTATFTDHRIGPDTSPGLGPLEIFYIRLGAAPDSDTATYTNTTGAAVSNATVCTTPDQTAANARWQSGTGVLVYGASSAPDNLFFEAWDLSGLSATITGVPA